MLRFRVEFEEEYGDTTTVEQVRESIIFRLKDEPEGLRVTEVSGYDPKYTTYGGVDPKVLINHKKVE